MLKVVVVLLVLCVAALAISREEAIREFLVLSMLDAANEMQHHPEIEEACRGPHGNVYNPLSIPGSPGAELRQLRFSGFKNFSPTDVEVRLGKDVQFNFKLVTQFFVMTGTLFMANRSESSGFTMTMFRSWENLKGELRVVDDYSYDLHNFNIVEHQSKTKQATLGFKKSSFKLYTDALKADLKQKKVSLCDVEIVRYLGKYLSSRFKEFSKLDIDSGRLIRKRPQRQRRHMHHHMQHSMSESMESTEKP